MVSMKLAHPAGVKTGVNNSISYSHYRLGGTGCEGGRREAK
jgi:hypothetical protein